MDSIWGTPAVLGLIQPMLTCRTRQGTLKCLQLPVLSVSAAASLPPLEVGTPQSIPLALRKVSRIPPRVLGRGQGPTWLGTAEAAPLVGVPTGQRIKGEAGTILLEV